MALHHDSHWEDPLRSVPLGGGVPTYLDARERRTRRPLKAALLISCVALAVATVVALNAPAVTGPSGELTTGSLARLEKRAPGLLSSGALRIPAPARDEDEDR